MLAPTAHPTLAYCTRGLTSLHRPLPSPGMPLRRPLRLPPTLPPTTPLTHDAKPPAICLAGARRPLRASPLPCRRASYANYDRTPPASRRKAAGCLPRGRTPPPPCRAAHLRAPSLTRALWQHATAARSKATSCLSRGRTQPPPCRASRLRAARPHTRTMAARHCRTQQSHQLFASRAHTASSVPCLAAPSRQGLRHRRLNHL